MIRTKIVCTIGPATESIESIRALAKAGMDVARLNFSHGDHAWHRMVIERIRTISEELATPVTILQDLGGPKLRVMHLPSDPLQLCDGQTLMITPYHESTAENWIDISVPITETNVAPGDRILLADGAVELSVKAVTSTGVTTLVVHGGSIRSRAGVNFPDSNTNLPSVTEKDIEDLKFGIHMGVDWIALSFVRSSQDIIQLKQAMQELGAVVPIIAKIEKPQALKNLEAILDAADGAMVARGDLGVETRLENVPLAQKRIIRECLKRSKPVITATQMLESMVQNATPTRAEVADVANAILDGTDAVMLSAETSIGKFPIEACSMANIICRTIEQEQRLLDTDWTAHTESIPDAVANASILLAHELHATVIIACTLSGATVRKVSSQRPCAPILALTSDPLTFRRLPLLWGVHPFFKAMEDNIDSILEDAVAIARNNQFIESGKPYVIIAGHPPKLPGKTNLVRVDIG